MPPQRLLALFAALILYASFYPFQFETKKLVHALQTSLWGALTFRYSGPGDTIANLAAYVPIGIFARLCLPQQGIRYSLLSIAGGMLLSVLVEIGQIATRTRNPSLMDVLLNTASTTVGVLLADWLWIRLAPKVDRALRANIPTVAILLGLVWIAMHAAPFIPFIGMNKLRDALAPVKTFQWTSQGVATWFAGWLIVSAVLHHVVARSHHKAAFLITAVLSLLMDLSFLGHSISWNEILALALASPLALFAGPRLKAGFVCAALLVSGLSPFRFHAAAAKFGWVPFLGLLESDLGIAFRVASEKSYLYAGAVWMLYRAGYARLVSGLSVAILLAVVEAAQVYLPGRSPETADPIIALLGIMLLEGKSERCEPSDTARQQQPSLP